MAAASVPSGNGAWSTIIDIPDVDGLRGSCHTLNAKGSVTTAIVVDNGDGAARARI